MRAVAAAVAVSLVTVLAACGSKDNNTAPITISAAGTWNLQTVNGTALPYFIPQAAVGDTVAVTNDVITASPTGTFTESTNVRLVHAGQVSTQVIPDAGTYTMNGTSVAFKFNSDGSTGMGTLNGSTLTLTQGTLSLVYGKQ